MTVKKLVSALVLAASFVLAAPSPARAEDKVLGTVTKIDLASKDAAAAVAILQDTGSGKSVAITVLDKVTLDKFKDHRINVGDEIKARFEKKDGKNVATYFKKPGGCS